MLAEIKKAIREFFRPLTSLIVRCYDRLDNYANRDFCETMLSVFPTRLSFKPDYAIPPGETLLETLGIKGMSIDEFSDLSLLSSQELRGIVEGKTTITEYHAKIFEAILETPASFWINLEKNYRDSLKRLGRKK
jgi:plasmid maintenance system antidote protein VapI